MLGGFESRSRINSCNINMEMRSELKKICLMDFRLVGYLGLFFYSFYLLYFDLI